MENSKQQLQVINTNILSNIESNYVNSIKEIQEYYPEHIKNKIDNLSDAAQKDVVKAGRRFISGIKSSIPMICKGSSCCLKSTCALLKNDAAPLNYQCPYEELMVDKLTAEYYSTLQVDPFNRVERDLIKQW